MSHVYEIITERILGKLEQGVVPWHKPWEQGVPTQPGHEEALSRRQRVLDCQRWLCLTLLAHAEAGERASWEYPQGREGYAGHFLEMAGIRSGQ